MIYNVLFLDHQIDIAGGQRSLLTLLAGLDRKRFKLYVAHDLNAIQYDKMLAQLDLIRLPILYNRVSDRSLYEGNINADPLKLAASIPLAFSTIYTLTRLIKRFKIQIIHTNTFKTGIFGGISAKLCNIPMIFRARSSLYYSNHGWIDKLVYSLADLILANSEFVKSSFNEIERIQNQKSQKIIALYNPIDFSAWKINPESRDAIRNEFGISEDTMLLGVVGRITERKRQEDVIRALRILLDEGVKVKLLLIGEKSFWADGHYPKYINQLVEKMNLELNVIYTGFRQDIKDVMSALDIMVLPSILEPLARVIFEAQYSRIPVIVSRSGGNLELVKDGINGLLFEPKNEKDLASKIRYFRQNPKKVGRMKEVAYFNICKLFSPKNTIRVEENLYLSMIDGFKKGPAKYYGSS